MICLINNTDLWQNYEKISVKIYGGYFKEFRDCKFDKKKKKIFQFHFSCFVFHLSSFTLILGTIVEKLVEWYFLYFPLLFESLLRLFLIVTILLVRWKACF